MQFSAQQIATLLKGNIEGSPDVVVGQLAKIEEAKSGDLSFLANPKYEHFLYTTNASIVVVNADFVPTQTVNSTLIRVKDAYSSFSELLTYYSQMKLERSGREEPSFVHESVMISDNVYVGAFSYIGKNAKIGQHVKIYPHVYIGDDVTIGDYTTLFPGVKVYSECSLGQHVVLHAGVVIGSDGFGFAPQDDGSYNKVPQIGNVVVDDNVEIGANTVVDRATMGSTIIRKGVKLDNLIQIAHNVEIGKNTVIAAQTGVSGSTKIGENVVLGGQVGVVGHITVADRSQVQAQSGVNRSIVQASKKWGGSPATPYQAQLRSQVLYSKLPELEKRIADLEQIIQNHSAK
ncbi:UDP-3-O-(3-hydroxymyristoyl)glucosamine N-acyltransferase [Sphingobacterium sp. SYP-B4668]|uniref:UDP-3-O-(3-hydroxymyristoyl)glucosamine N-acyltransferase n=1 Tax=Sphingobacterium sp. SYP-B4668 TaxID=2996035 RepID=UPI0022DDEC57|nr:UDP-3-O-(3-hydroxymyristoyl)glucosamine N-acyltransferase [Sphingobacterium sp. SYP-B4668]